MGLLKFTKQYSATNDGEKYAGTDIGTMQADIASILNGGISNVNIASDAAIAESKVSFSTTSGHTHNGTDSKAISSSGVIAVGTIWGAELVYSAADKVYAKPGSIEINGTLYSRTAVSTTIDTDTNTQFISGSSERGVSKWLYVYAYNDSGSSWDIKYSATAPAYSNCGTSTDGNKMFLSASSVWYRCIGAVRLGAAGSGNIVSFYQFGNRIYYDDVWGNSDLLVKNAGSDAAFADITASTAVPELSTLGIFNYTIANGVGALYVRANGSAATNGISLRQNEANGCEMVDEIPLDSTQKFEYKIDANSTTVYCAGYILNIR